MGCSCLHFSTSSRAGSRDCTIELRCWADAPSGRNAIRTAIRVLSPRPVLETRDLSVSYYKRITAVRHLTLSVQERETVAIIGPNGAGKTSALRAIAGFLRREPAAISQGQVLLDGNPITKRT